VSDVQEVAVKLLPLAGASEGEVKVVLREAVALAWASEYCKYASRLLGMCRKDGNFCLVMKKYAGSLSSKLNTYAGMDACGRSNMAIQCADFIAYCKESCTSIS
jgi:hypothetical protein